MKNEQASYRDELIKFNGTWQLISAIKDGVSTSEEVVQKIRVVIQDGKHIVYFGEEPAVKEVPFTVDPTTQPKRTVDTLPDGQVIRGIYLLEGDMLTSCVAEAGKDFPNTFTSKPGSGNTLRKFRRINLTE